MQRTFVGSVIGRWYSVHSRRCAMRCATLGVVGVAERRVYCRVEKQPTTKQVKFAPVLLVDCTEHHMGRCSRCRALIRKDDGRVSPSQSHLDALCRHWRDCAFIKAKPRMEEQVAFTMQLREDGHAAPGDARLSGDRSNEPNEVGAVYRWRWRWRRYGWGRWWQRWRMWR